MADSSSVSSIFSESYKPKTNNIKAFFVQEFNIITIGYDLINKFIIYKFYQYAAANVEDFSLWNCIQVNFEKYEIRHLDEPEGSTWNVIRNHCYPHRYWINYNFGSNKTCTTFMLDADKVNWNDEWTIEQIK